MSLSIRWGERAFSALLSFIVRRKQMSTITDQMFRASYEIGKKWYSHSMSYTESVRILHVQYGMNPHSADDYLYAYMNMADGKTLTRSISLAAVRYYLSKFLEDQGPTGLQKALSAIKQTIDHQEKSGTSTPVGLRRIYDSFLLRLYPKFSD